MYFLLQFSCQVQGKHRLDVNGEGAEPGTHQRLGVTEDMILQELVQHVEEVVLHERLNHQLVQVVLRGEKLPVNHLTHTHTKGEGAGPDLHGDLELVKRADVLHQHSNDKLVRDFLKNKSVHQQRGLADDVTSCFNSFIAEVQTFCLFFCS